MAFNSLVWDIETKDTWQEKLKYNDMGYPSHVLCRP